MTTEQIKQKAEEEFPYRETDKEITMYINQVLGLRQAAYLRCWEENCLPIQKENEKLKEGCKLAASQLNTIADCTNGIPREMAEMASESLLKLLSGEGNGVASEK